MKRTFYSIVFCSLLSVMAGGCIATKDASPQFLTFNTNRPINHHLALKLDETTDNDPPSSSTRQTNRNGADKHWHLKEGTNGMLDFLSVKASENVIEWRRKGTNSSVTTPPFSLVFTNISEWTNNAGAGLQVVYPPSPFNGLNVLVVNSTNDGQDQRIVLEWDHANTNGVTNVYFISSVAFNDNGAQPDYDPTTYNRDIIASTLIWDNDSKPTVNGNTFDKVPKKRGRFSAIAIDHSEKPSAHCGRRSIIGFA